MSTIVCSNPLLSSMLGPKVKKSGRSAVVDDAGVFFMKGETGVNSPP